MTEARRLNHVKEYYFSSKLKALAEMRCRGKEIINLGVGSPDLPPPPNVVEALTTALSSPGAHQYQPYKGTDSFRQAVVDFYKMHFHTTLEPQTEVLPLMGSKEGIFHISSAFLNPGDQVLIPNPGYPTYSAVTRLMEATPVFYELSPENDWLPDLEKLERQDLSKVKLMWVNYPHMPTGTQGDLSLFRDLITFAKRNAILLINDNPYSFILNKNPLSFLEIEGAKDVVLELNSLSKSFNMSGWRVGMLCGSEKNINSVLKVKTNMDSGMFFPVMAGAEAALKLPISWFAQQNEHYVSRKILMKQLLQSLGCTLDAEQVGMFLWAKVPEGMTSEEFVEKLIHECGLFAAPGFIFGSQGEGYVRFSLCASEDVIRRAIEKVTKKGVLA